MSWLKKVLGKEESGGEQPAEEEKAAEQSTAPADLDVIQPKQVKTPSDESARPASSTAEDKPQSERRVKLADLNVLQAEADEAAQEPELLQIGGTSDAPAERRVVKPPVLVDQSEMSGYSDEIRIKARPERDEITCTFLVDRPVLKGLSVFLPDASTAREISPLGAAIFEVEGVDSLIIHDMTLTVTRDPMAEDDWEPMAKKIGGIVRQHLKDNRPVVTEEFLENMPPEDEIKNQLQRVIDLEINPGIAAHSGVITLENVRGNTAYINMGGGCQGCAASTITLREGIHRAFRASVPEVGAILDTTDHDAGSNPYFSELPEGMQ